MTIVGVSFDSTAANAAFREAEGFRFELWSDTERTLAMYYGAASSPTQATASRVTRLLDATGALLLEYDEVSPATHPQEVLEDCRVLFGE